MGSRLRDVVTALILCLIVRNANAQRAPEGPSRIWHDPVETELNRQRLALPDTKYDIDPSKNYTLSELIDLAEQHNPETRAAWERAKSHAAAVGVARSALYPTLAALVAANTIRTRLLLGSDFFQQTYGSIAPEIALEYLIF